MDRHGSVPGPKQLLRPLAPRLAPVGAGHPVARAKGGPRRSGRSGIGGDKGLIGARGPLWHKKDGQSGEIPKGLHGVDTESTWG